MGEAVGRSLQQITPDFIVDTQDDGTITFTLNNGEVPELTLSQSFIDSMTEYQQNKEHLNRQTKEALLYIKKKVDAAQNFIEAIRTRRHTLTVTMHTIINLQRQFCLEGDEMEGALGGYLSVLYDQNPKAVGGALPDEGFWYRK